MKNGREPCSLCMTVSLTPKIWNSLSASTRDTVLDSLSIKSKLNKSFSKSKITRVSKRKNRLRISWLIREGWIRMSERRLNRIMIRVGGSRNREGNIKWSLIAMRMGDSDLKFEECSRHGSKRKRLISRMKKWLICFDLIIILSVNV